MLLKFSSVVKNELCKLGRKIKKVQIKLSTFFEINPIIGIKEMYKEEEMKRRIKVSSAKAKARRFQNWVCKQISKITGISYGYEDDKLISPRIMGQSGVDVVLRGEALKQFPFSVECKSSEQWNLPSAIRQCKSNQRNNTEWLLFLKKTEFKNPVVVMDGYAFFRLVGQLKNLLNGIEDIKDIKMLNNLIPQKEKK